VTALRAYQEKAVNDLEGHRKPLLVAPTGSGKTVISSAVIDRAPNSHVLFLAHRRELIFQSQEKLKSFGIQAGVIMAGTPRDTMRRVQVASVQTLHSRSIRGEEDLPPAQMVIVDEAHHCPAWTYKQIIERYPDAQLIGMTATPIRRDGRGLGGLFDALVETPQVEELIKLGHLVGTKVWAPQDKTPNLRGIATQGGDYVVSQLEQRVNTDKLVGDIISHWHRHANRRKTVVFATSVAHSRHLQEEFAKSGVRCEHIDGSTPKDERDQILHMLSSGDLDLVTNCMVLTEGWDQPDVGCIVLARPTKSMGLYRQMIGRGLRPFEGKDHCLVLDHSGATLQHGFVEDEMVWTLAEDKKATNVKDAAKGKPSDRLCECPACNALRVAGEACRHCGWEPKRRSEYHVVADGELAHLTRDGKLKPEYYSPAERQQFYQMLLHIVRENGYKPGWAAHKFNEKFGTWPNFGLNPLTAPTIEPTPEVKAWIRHLNIRFAKSRRAA
jgi:DNA repair protein RadD